MEPGQTEGPQYVGKEQVFASETNWNLMPGFDLQGCALTCREDAVESSVQVAAGSLYIPKEAASEGKMAETGARVVGAADDGRMKSHW